MDAVLTIASALTSGASAAIQGITSEGIRDAYQYLYGQIKRKLAGNTKAEIVLAEHAKDPATWEKPLTSTLSECDISDMEIIHAAQALLDLLRSQQSSGSIQQKVYNNAPVNQQNNIGQVHSLQIKVAGDPQNE